MPKFIVETVSKFKITYVVEADTKDQAKEFVTHKLDPSNQSESEEIREFTQIHLGENIEECVEVTDDEIVEAFYNFYISRRNSDSWWNKERILKIINKI